MTDDPNLTTKPDDAISLAKKSLLGTTPSLVRYWIGSISWGHAFFWGPILLFHIAFFAMMERPFAVIAIVFTLLTIGVFIAACGLAFFLRPSIAFQRRKAVSKNVRNALMETYQEKRMRETLRVDIWGNYVD